MNNLEILKKKRDGHELNEREIQCFLDTYLQGKLKDYQMTSFLMACFIQGLNQKETKALTKAMIESGETYQIPGAIDKHSTGGVGDKVSILLAPLVASFGIPIPMLSGRGLGHTGGTIDKLESIPGYKTALSRDEFFHQIEKNYFAMSQQQPHLVPADKALYALRDTSGTVESIPLITASILSKKYAEGARGLVLDVKCGRGAFMKTLEEAQSLANSLRDVGQDLGMKVSYLISNMDQVLGTHVGNWLEIQESVRLLEKPQKESDTLQLCIELAALMLWQAGKVNQLDEAYPKIWENLQNKKALEYFWRNVEGQGGQRTMLEEKLKKDTLAPYTEIIVAKDSGILHKTDPYLIGLALIELGGGRRTKDDMIDHHVGFEIYVKEGQKIDRNQDLLRIHAKSKKDVDSLRQVLLESFIIKENSNVPHNPLIWKRVL